MSEEEWKLDFSIHFHLLSIHDKLFYLFIFYFYSIRFNLSIILLFYSYILCFKEHTILERWIWINHWWSEWEWKTAWICIFWMMCLNIISYNKSIFPFFILFCLSFDRNAICICFLKIRIKIIEITIPE